MLRRFSSRLCPAVAVSTEWYFLTDNNRWKSMPKVVQDSLNAAVGNNAQSTQLSIGRWNYTFDLSDLNQVTQQNDRTKRVRQIRRGSGSAPAASSPTSASSAASGSGANAGTPVSSGIAPAPTGQPPTQPPPMPVMSHNACVAAVVKELFGCPPSTAVHVLLEAQRVAVQQQQRAIAAAASPTASVRTSRRAKEVWEFLDDNNAWITMPISAQSSLSRAVRRQKQVHVFRINARRYRFDLSDLNKIEQVNLRTRRTRSVRRLVSAPPIRTKAWKPRHATRASTQRHQQRVAAVVALVAGRPRGGIAVLQQVVKNCVSAWSQVYTARIRIQQAELKKLREAERAARKAVRERRAARRAARQAARAAWLADNSNATSAADAADNGQGTTPGAAPQP